MFTGNFKEQLISFLNFGQNYFVQLRGNWFSVRLPVTYAWNCRSLYIAFSSNVGAVSVFFNPGNNYMYLTLIKLYGMALSS